MECSIKKINKLKRLIAETEDCDEKEFLEYTLNRKLGNESLTEKTKMDPIINLIDKEKINVLRDIFIKKIKVNWNKYIFYSKPPLHLAIENGDLKLIKLLLENNYPLWLPDKNNRSPFELVCLYKDPGLIKNFINFGANIKKILYLRNNTKNIKFYHNNIDFLILGKKILIEENNINMIRKIIKNNQIRNTKDIIGLEDFTWTEFKIGLHLYLEKEFPNMLFLLQELKSSKNLSDYLIFYFLFELDFGFNIEDENYFFLELNYNKINESNMDKLYYKFLNDYSAIYSKQFLDLIWYKYKNKIISS